VDRTVPAGALPGAVADATSELLDQVEGTVGVITSGAARDRVAGWLAAAGPGDDLRLQVVTSLEAKGMEYDGVVLVEPAGIVAHAGDRESGLRVLYVALTRATQRLVTVGTVRWWG
jgi:superfamily I DNA/RNA helicase